ncbi:MAG: DUF1801 domain-containing protein [Hyphomonadaceae bacterium]
MAAAKPKAKKSAIKTKPTKVSVADFIAAVPNETRRKDAQTLLKLYEKATGWKAQMWGPTIIGFGRYTYTYDSGHSGDMCVSGFSPRGASLSIYAMYPEQPEAQAILKDLGKHKSSKACVYINKLEDVDLKVLEKFIKAGVASMKKVSKEKGWPLEGT